MEAMIEQAVTTYSEALKYISTLEKGLDQKSRFSNDLLYNIVTMSFEKLFVAYLASFNINATHHTPLALFNEANDINPLPEYMKDTAILISKFESICSFDGFGYKTPSDNEIKIMILGLIAIRDYMKN
jgi:hypothetical protein